MWLPITALVVGFLVVFLPPNKVMIPADYAEYIGVALVAGFDSVIGAVRSVIEGKFSIASLSAAFSAMRCWRRCSCILATNSASVMSAWPSWSRWSSAFSTTWASSAVTSWHVSSKSVSPRRIPSRSREAGKRERGEGKWGRGNRFLPRFPSSLFPLFIHGNHCAACGTGAACGAGASCGAGAACAAGASCGAGVSGVGQVVALSVGAPQVLGDTGGVAASGAAVFATPAVMFGLGAMANPIPNAIRTQSGHTRQVVRR